MHEERLSDVELIRRGAIKGREALEILNTGEYLFHGSMEKVERLEPRQAYTIQDNVRIKDGEPAVWATDNIDVAIFMAIAKPFGRAAFRKIKENKLMHFTISDKLARKLETVDPKAYVLVLPRTGFKGREVQFKANEGVNLEFIIEVSKKDLPKNIEIKEGWGLPKNA
jgi:hypothetical protein